MRQIKFRAWSHRSKTMFDWGSLLQDDLASILTSGQEEVMQYTGLKDKNGKEIYGGDILEDRQRKDRTFRVQIFSVPGGFAYNTFPDELKEPQFYDPMVSLGDMQNGDWITHCEVIGNIWENPELLIKNK